MIHPFFDNDVQLFFIIIPVAATIIVYFVNRYFLKNHWKAIHFTVQTTAIFYLVAVVLLLEKLFGQPIIGTVLIILIVILSIILIWQRKRKTEVVLLDGLKILLRICFLSFGLLYLLLISYEIFIAVYINYLD